MGNEALAADPSGQLTALLSSALTSAQPVLLLPSSQRPFRTRAGDLVGSTSLLPALDAWAKKATTDQIPAMGVKRGLAVVLILLRPALHVFRSLRRQLKGYPAL